MWGWISVIPGSPAIRSFRNRSAKIGCDIDIYFHYEGIGKYDLSVYLHTDGAVGVYGYGVTYNPLLLSWRAKYT